jgi:hypothetical protein
VRYLGEKRMGKITKITHDLFKMEKLFDKNFIPYNKTVIYNENNEESGLHFGYPQDMLNLTQKAH